MDCMEALREMEDNQFDLAIVDPPYGIGASEKNSTTKMQSRSSATCSTSYGNQKWDDAVPDGEYFDQIKRVSKKQIIWGANFFGLSGGMLFWDKAVTMPTYSSGELAWLSWKQSIDYYKFDWHGMIQKDMKNKEHRIHPTQKPVALYKWLLQKYAQEGDKILDTHTGSASIAIACHDAGYDLTGYELDEDYFKAALHRLETHRKQGQFEFA